MRQRSRLPGGFTLVGVVVAIAILTILIAAVGPSIATIMQRDNEFELVFRGKQYARAIVAFQKRYGRYPTSLKELRDLHPHTIRRLWKDPMCNCDDWQIIIAGTPEAAPMGSNLQIPGGSGPGLQRTPPAPGNQPPSTYGGLFPPVTPAPNPETAPSSTSDGFGTGGIFGSGGKTIGPIVGVRSKVHKKALRQWRDRDYYDEWRFIAGDADNDLAQTNNPNVLRGPGNPLPPPPPATSQ